VFILPKYKPSLRMIQRIQTLLLAATALLLIINLFVPIWSNTESTGTVIVNAYTIEYKVNAGAVTKENVALSNQTKNVIYIATLAGISAALCIYTMVLYNNRLKQIKISNFLTLLTLGLIGAYFLAIPAAKEMMTTPSNGTYHFGYFIPILCNVLLLAARYFIRKDEELVKSVDRIR